MPPRPRLKFSYQRGEPLRSSFFVGHPRPAVSLLFSAGIKILLGRDQTSWRFLRFARRLGEGVRGKFGVSFKTFDSTGHPLDLRLNLRCNFVDPFVNISTGLHEVIELLCVCHLLPGNLRRRHGHRLTSPF